MIISRQPLLPPSTTEVCPKGNSARIPILKTCKQGYADNGAAKDKACHKILDSHHKAAKDNPNDISQDTHKYVSIIMIK